MRRWARLLALTAPASVLGACQIISGLSGYQTGNGGGATSSASTSTGGAGSTGTGGTTSGSSGSTSSGSTSSGDTGPCGVSCVDPLVDAGACGDASFCDPVPISATDLYSIGFIAADSTNIYWVGKASMSGPEILYRKSASSPAAPIALNLSGAVYGLATDGQGAAYFSMLSTSQNGLYDQTQTLVSRTGLVNEVGGVAALDPAHIAWAAELQTSDYTVYVSMPLSDAGQDTPLWDFGGFPFPTLLVAGSETAGVYFSELAYLWRVNPTQGGRYVGNAPFSGGQPVLLAPDRDASGYVYWIASGNDGGSPQLQRIPKDADSGTGPDAWSIPVTTPMGLTATTQPYWIDGTSLYTAVGSSVQMVAPISAAEYGNLTTDGTYLYFSDKASSGGYAVFRVRVAH